MNDKQRTTLQNRSLHKMFRDTSETMNNCGLTQRGFWEKAKRDFDLPISENYLKEVFQAVCETTCGKDKTSELTTKELQYAFDVFQHGIAQSCGIAVVWPADEIPLCEEHEV